MGRARRTTLTEPACYHLTHRCQEWRFLSRCLFYIDLNMVRAGAVEQPAQWDACGCRELGLAEEQPRRGAVIDRKRLLDCLEFGGNWQAFAEWHRRTLGELVSSG